MIKTSEKKKYRINSFEILQKAKQMEQSKKDQGWKYVFLQRTKKLVNPDKINELLEQGWRLV